MFFYFPFYKTKKVQNYRLLWTGVGAQLARDVPFSAICWSTLEPVCSFSHCNLFSNSSFFFLFVFFFSF
jgi:hypothetical protein